MMKSEQLPAHEASATGLDPSVAATLAYLAGPFSGIVILLAERDHRFVRFHAWQSIIGLGGLGALAVGLMVAAFIALLITPVLFVVMYWMAFLTAFVWLVAWVICLYKAFQGEMWQLPLAGDRAMRRANGEG
jgi:uncharacterized membrane protein